MAQDINRHNMIMRAFEKSLTPLQYDTEKFYSEFTQKEEFLERRTRLAFYNFRDGFEAGYLCRVHAELVK